MLHRDTAIKQLMAFKGGAPWFEIKPKHGLTHGYCLKAIERPLREALSGSSPEDALRQTLSPLPAQLRKYNDRLLSILNDNRSRGEPRLLLRSAQLIYDTAERRVVASYDARSGVVQVDVLAESWTATSQRSLDYITIERTLPIGAGQNRLDDPATVRLGGPTGLASRVNRSLFLNGARRSQLAQQKGGSVTPATFAHPTRPDQHQRRLSYTLQIVAKGLA